MTDMDRIKQFLDKYSEFKRKQFDSNITNEKLENAERELNDQICGFQQEIEDKNNQISSLQKTFRWKLYNRAKRNSFLHYIILYILAFGGIYFLWQEGRYPLSFLPEFFILDFSNTSELLWKGALFGIIGLIIWHFLKLNSVFTFIPRVIARKELAEIEKLNGEEKAIKEQQTKAKELFDMVMEYKYFAYEHPVQNIIRGLEAWLEVLKDGRKSEDMYQEFYSWVEFLYDIGCEDAEKYEYILLHCEEAVWLTPKNRQEYCKKRIEEICRNSKRADSYNYTGFTMRYHTAGLAGYDPSVKSEPNPADVDYISPPHIDPTGM